MRAWSTAPTSPSPTGFAAAGVQRVLLWPLTDPVRRLELLRERVLPLVGTP
ncbi:hypothetical protein ACI8AA_06485 [Geodermatophilus sp. SYSU D01180]